MRLCAFALASTPLLSVSALLAQSAERLRPDDYGVVYDLPATRRVALRPDVPFAQIGNRSLKLDLYLPPDLKAGQRRPAVVFLNAIGDPPADTVRRWAIYSSWPRLVAAHGMVGIAMDADGERIQESLRGLFRYLRHEGPARGIDPDRLGVYAASANVSGANTYLMSDSVDRGIRAAVLYYGGVPEGHLRTDLPVFFVVAQSDVPRLGPALPALWQRVVDSALPWTLVYGRGLPHAFDAFADTDDSRRLIQQTLGFWRSHLEPVPPLAGPPSEGRTILAALFGNDSPRAAELLTKWVKTHPTDPESFANLGRVQADLRRFAEAESAYTRAYELDSTNPGVLNGLGQLRLGQQRWDQAEAIYLRLVQAGFENSLVQGQIGWARLHLGKNAEAVANYERALELGVPAGRFRALAYYNLACGYVRVGRRDDALVALGRAVDQGMTDRATYENDEDLNPLRGDPRFQQLLSRLK
jgi:Flp pilus assembly protein TadD